jgi:uncharacterized membrane protein
VTDDLVWATLLLFALSLVPFATADLGEDHVERAATRSYFVVLLLPVAGYVWLQAVIRHTDARAETASLYRR